MTEKALSTKSSVPELSGIEKEVSILLSSRHLIQSMVNNAMLLFGFGSDGAEAKPQNMHASKLFSILLVELLSPINSEFGKADSYLLALKQICDRPYFDHKGSVSELQNAVSVFIEWLNHDAHFNGVWLPSIGLETDLKMRREEFLRICGDISKHNDLRLSKTTQRILRVLHRSNPTLTQEHAFAVLDDFYRWFYDDIFHYHLSTLAEMLNNVAWGIQTYLGHEYSTSYTKNEELSKDTRAEIYSFQMPRGVTSELGQLHYWSLMNEIRDEPIIRRFSVGTYMKKRY